MGTFIFILGFLTAVIVLFIILKTDDHPYKYHVVYFFKDKSQSGIGSMNINRSKRISSVEDTISMKKFIEQENKQTDVVILIYIRFK